MDYVFKYNFKCTKCDSFQHTDSPKCGKCKQMYFGTNESPVRCDRCNEPAMGLSYRGEYTAGHPLRMLTERELDNPHYKILGPQIENEFIHLRFYVGKFLCVKCHPSRGIREQFNLAQEQDSDVIAAYKDLGDRIKQDLAFAAKERPTMTEEEKYELAKELMATKYKKVLRREPFKYERLEHVVRKSIAKAIPSNIFFKKLTKDELHEPILAPDYDAIDAARRSMDMLEYKRVIRDEVHKINKRVNDLFESLANRGGGKKVAAAGTGGDLMSAIREVEAAIEQKLEEISVLESGIKSQAGMLKEIENGRSLAFQTVEEIKAKIEQADPASKKALGEELFKAQAELTRWSQRAEDLHTSGIMREQTDLRKRIDSISAILFKRYKPLLDTLHNIIDWDIKEDLAVEYDGRPNAIKFYPLVRNEELEKKEEILQHDPFVTAEDIDAEPKPLRCENCMARTEDLKLVSLPVTRTMMERGAQLVRPMSLDQIALRSIRELTKMSAADVAKTSAVDLKKIGLETIENMSLDRILALGAKSLKEFFGSMSLCNECATAKDRLSRFSTTGEDFTVETRYQERVKADVAYRFALKSYDKRNRETCKAVLKEAKRVLGAYTTKCIEALWFDMETTKYELNVVAVREGTPIPDTIMAYDYEVRVFVTTQERFSAAYLWAINGPVRRAKWCEKAKEKGWTYGPGGLDMSINAEWIKRARRRRLMVVEPSEFVREKKSFGPVRDLASWRNSWTEDRPVMRPFDVSKLGACKTLDRIVTEPDAIVGFLGVDAPYKPIEWKRGQSLMVDWCDSWEDDEKLAKEREDDELQELPFEYWLIHGYQQYVNRLCYEALQDEAEFISDEKYMASWYKHLKDTEKKPWLPPPPKGGFHEMKQIKTYPIMMVGKRSRKKEDFTRHAPDPKKVEEWKDEKAVAALRDRAQDADLKAKRKEEEERQKKLKRVVVHLPKKKKR